MGRHLYLGVFCLRSGLILLQFLFIVFLFATNFVNPFMSLMVAGSAWPAIIIYSLISISLLYNYGLLLLGRDNRLKMKAIMVDGLIIYIDITTSIGMTLPFFLVSRSNTSSSSSSTSSTSISRKRDFDIRDIGNNSTTTQVNAFRLEVGKIVASYIIASCLMYLITLANIVTSIMTLQFGDHHDTEPDIDIERVLKVLNSEALADAQVHHEKKYFSNASNESEKEKSEKEKSEKELAYEKAVREQVKACVNYVHESAGHLVHKLKAERAGIRGDTANDSHTRWLNIRWQLCLIFLLIRPLQILSGLVTAIFVSCVAAQASSNLSNSPTDKAVFTLITCFAVGMIALMSNTFAQTQWWLTRTLVMQNIIIVLEPLSGIICGAGAIALYVTCSKNDGLEKLGLSGVVAKSLVTVVASLLGVQAILLISPTLLGNTLIWTELPSFIRKHKADENNDREDDKPRTKFISTMLSTLLSFSNPTLMASCREREQLYPESLGHRQHFYESILGKGRIFTIPKVKKSKEG